MDSILRQRVTVRFKYNVPLQVAQYYVDLYQVLFTHLVFVLKWLYIGSRFVSADATENFRQQNVVRMTTHKFCLN